MQQSAEELSRFRSGIQLCTRIADESWSDVFIFLNCSVPVGDVFVHSTVTLFENRPYAMTISCGNAAKDAIIVFLTSAHSILGRLNAYLSNLFIEKIL